MEKISSESRKKTKKKYVIRNSPYDQCLEFEKIGLKISTSKRWLVKENQGWDIVPSSWTQENGRFVDAPSILTFDLQEILDILPGQIKKPYPTAPPWHELFSLEIDKLPTQGWSIGYFSELLESRRLRTEGPELLIAAGELLLNAIETNFLTVSEINLGITKPSMN